MAVLRMAAHGAMRRKATHGGRWRMVVASWRRRMVVLRMTAHGAWRRKAPHGGRWRMAARGGKAVVVGGAWRSVARRMARPMARCMAAHGGAAYPV